MCQRECVSFGMLGVAVTQHAIMFEQTHGIGNAGWLTISLSWLHTSLFPHNWLFFSSLQYTVVHLLASYLIMNAVPSLLFALAMASYIYCLLLVHIKHPPHYTSQSSLHQALEWDHRIGKPEKVARSKLVCYLFTAYT